MCVCVCVAVPPREALGARHSGQCHLLLRAWKQPRLPPPRPPGAPRAHALCAGPAALRRLERFAITAEGQGSVSRGVGGSNESPSAALQVWDS